MMEFDGEFTSDHPRDELWNYFTDPEILADCAPGCDEITMESPGELSATITVGVGSVKPTFDVDMTVTRADAPETLEMEVGGDASRNSFEAVTEMNLVEDGDGTIATWEAHTNVAGLIASMGQRALGSVAGRIVNNFFEDLEAKADEGVPAESKLEAKPEAEASLEN
ncbi:CoxG family protein [Halococcus agarilyticus]|uniref:CoxG family protein n=1 Tax=Halococcus agarilyticus TaxID=1232219 RepID=UPI0009ACB227|nr:carbon monoxide dehydrogenase subunit G [Halococcus agarilyticus]